MDYEKKYKEALQKIRELIIDFLWKNRKGDTDGIYQQEQDIKWLRTLKKEWEDKL